MNVQKNKKINFKELYDDLLSPEGAHFKHVASMLEDRTGLFWVGHEYKGVRIFRNENKIFTPLEGLLSKYVSRFDFTQMSTDDEGNLWVCTIGSGIFKISIEGKVKNYLITDPEFPESDGNYAYSLLEIKNGIFWIGARNGLWELDCNTGKSKKLFPQFIQSGYIIYHLLKIEDNIIIQSQNQGLWVYNLITNQLKQYTINQNDLFGLKSNNIIAINEMKNGEIWVSTRRPAGMNRISINKTTGEIRFLTLPETVTKNFQIILENVSFITQIFQDKEGILWFCTNNGLVKLNIETGEIKKWTEDNGLNNDQIQSIQEDNNGNLWLGSLYGLSMLDRMTGIIRNFDENNGLPEVRHSWYSLKDNEGKIYFSGTGGFYFVNPDNIQKNFSIPPIVITDFRLFNKSIAVDSTRNAILTKNISYTREIKLKYNQNDLSFTFAALDYNDPSKNRYAYMLEGYQKEWIKTGADNRIATYTNLKPGEYTFRVKGSNNDDVWNEEGTFINIIIRPPFWKTTLAYIIYVILFLLLLRGYVYLRTRMIRKEKIHLEKQVNDRTEELQEVNTLLEEQKEELMQQKEELQTTLENLQKTQEQLVESEKLSALGGLVAGVAHEINTPVGIGVTAVSSLQLEIQKMAALYKKDEISRKDFKEFLESANDSTLLIQKNLQRTAELVQSFKQVSADQVSEQQRAFNLRSYLEDIIRSMHPKFKQKQIDFNIECDKDLELNSYPGAYAQVFTNLLLNSFTHGFHDRQTGTVIIHATHKDGFIQIEYRDDGEGISKKDLPHIFEPFYTTDQRKGTGLGLNIVYNIVKHKLHGNITCKSEPGEGVLFIIELLETFKPKSNGKEP
jgi:signal transduction histidine kinase/ligand-binding sensor domain-containing protein